MGSDIARGATIYDGGCRFRVWAPNADSVFVLGSFNDWDKEAHKLESEDNGFWSGDVKGVKVGDEYRYLILNGEQEIFRMDPYSRCVTSSVGNSRVCGQMKVKDGEQYQIGPLNKLVIYELHIGTFGRKIGEAKPGTLSLATERLDHLKELGVNVLEVMPMAEFPGGFSWGYNPSMIFAIESDYGGPEEFAKFVNRAHELGIAVVVDVVYNHFGPGDLDLWQFDGWSENDKGGIYFYNDDRSQTPWGDTRPDYGRGEVRQYIRDNALMWFKEYGVDGLRWDATAFIRNVKGNDGDEANDIADGWSLMQWVNADVYNQKKDALLIAEDLRQNAFITKSSMDSGAGFVSQWDRGFVAPIRQMLREADDNFRNVDEVRDAISFKYYLNAFDRVIYTESHDEIANGHSRVPEEVDPGKASSWAAKKKSALGAALVMTSPGVPMLFQGQEFLEDDWFHERDPIDWNKRNRFSGIFRLYQDLIALRLDKQGLTAGLCGQEVNVYHLNESDKMIAYYRWATDEPEHGVVVVANLSVNMRENYELGFPVAGKWQVRFNSDSKIYDDSFGDVGSTVVDAVQGDKDGLAAKGAVNIGGYSVLILSLAKAKQ